MKEKREIHEIFKYKYLFYSVTITENIEYSSLTNIKDQRTTTIMFFVARTKDAFHSR